MESKIADWLVEKRWFLAIASILMVAVAGYGFTFFYLDGSPRAFLGENNEGMNRLTLLERDFGRTNNAIILVAPSPENESASPKNFQFEREQLRALTEFTDKALVLPNVMRVESLINYQHSWAEEDELIVESLLDDIESLSDDEIVNAQINLSTEVAVLDRLITSDGNYAGLNIQFNIQEGDQNAANESAESLFALVESLREKYPNIAIYPSGTIVNDFVTLALAAEDTGKVISVMYLVMFALLAIVMRSTRAMFIIVCVTMLSVVGGVGFACWLGAEFASLTMLSFSIIIVVTIAHCVHLLMGFLQTYREGEEKIEALRKTIRVNLQPVFLTSFTTMIGFLSMNINDMPPVRHLGNITAAGVAAAFILSFALLPALVSISRFSNSRSLNSLDSNTKTETGKAARRDLYSLMETFSYFVIRHHVLLLIMSTVVSIAGLYLATQNIMNDRMAEAIERPHHIRVDNDKVDQHLGGIFNFQFRLSADDGKTVSDPEYLQALDDFTQFLRQQDEITNVFTFSDVIKRLNRNMHGDDPAFYTIPENKELSAQYLLLYELSLPQGMDLTNQITFDKTASRVVVTFSSMDSAGVNKLRNKVRAWQQENLPSYMQFDGTSYMTIWTDLPPVALKASLKGAIFALLLISIILIAVFKSFKFGIISLLPNLLPAAIGFGIWKLYSGELHFGLMMVLTITIGIVVDDTVHFLSKYRRAVSEEGKTAADAVTQTFIGVGPALTLTTFVLVVGFLIMTFSQFMANTDVGLLTASVIAAALFLDFFMLPSLLLLFKVGEKTPQDIPEDTSETVQI